MHTHHLGVCLIGFQQILRNCWQTLPMQLVQVGNTLQPSQYWTVDRKLSKFKHLYSDRHDCEVEMLNL